MANDFILLEDIYFYNNRPCKLFAPMLSCGENFIVWLLYLDGRREVVACYIDDLFYSGCTGKILFGDDSVS